MNQIVIIWLEYRYVLVTLALVMPDSLRYRLQIKASRL